MNALLIGKGHIGTGLLHYFETNKNSNVLVADSSNLESLVGEGTPLKKLNYVIIAAAVTGGVEHNVRHGVKLSQDNSKLNQLLAKVIKSTECQVINFVPSCVYPVSSTREKSHPDLLGIEPLESTSRLFAESQLERIETLNSLVNSDMIRHIVLTNVFGLSNSSKPNSHFFDHLLSSTKRRSGDTIVMRGSGTGVRDFIYNKEIPGILEFILKSWNKLGTVTNFAGYGEIVIDAAAQLFIRTLGLNIKVIFDKPELQGVSYKVLDDTMVRNLGWKPLYTFEGALTDWLRLTDKLEPNL